MRIDPASAEPNMIANLVDFAGMRVLEVGSGDGRMTSMIAGKASGVLSIDPDEEAIAIGKDLALSRQMTNVEYRVEDICTMRLEDGEFDSAFLALSL